MSRNPPVRGASAEKLLCSCGHQHARGEKCGAVVSGTPMITYCQCPGGTPNGEHLAPVPVNPTGL